MHRKCCCLCNQYFQTLSELVPAGIEAVLVAFRTGLRSLELRNDIVRPVPETSRSWSVVVSGQEEQVATYIEAFNIKKVSPSIRVRHLID
jgi:naphtho-gamma-pyrone polyketide synthase